MENRLNLFMYRITLIIILMFFCFSNIKAQEDTYDIETDKQTLKLYNEKNWNELIRIGKEANEKQIDFYYLNLRIGIAYFRKENYRLAIPYFKKALRTKQNDSVTLEYLYFAFLNSGRDNDAGILSKPMPNSLKEKLNIKSKPFLEGIYIAGNLLFNNNITILNKLDTDGAENIYGEQSFINKHTFYSLGLKNNFGQRISANYTFSMVEMEQNQQISTLDTNYNFNISNKQAQYYINLSYHFSESFDLSATFNLFDINAQTKLFQTRSSFSDFTEQNTYNIFDTAYNANAVLNVYDTIFNYHEIRTPVFSTDTITTMDKAFSISLHKDIRQFRVGLHGAYSQLYGIKSVQAGLSVVYYPLGNLDMYTYTDIIAKKSIISGTGRIMPGFHAKQLVGLRIYKNLWTENFYSFGNMSNYMSNNASVMHNTGEIIKQTAGINFSYYMFEYKLKLQLSFITMQKKYSYLTYVLDSYTENTYQGIEHKSYTYENNETFWTDPQQIELTEAVPVFHPAYRPVKYFSSLFSFGLSYCF